tara:strand:+ start:868 stop:1137 length:270 start_codon:yes stop_codon:yes gene_type:complete
MNKMVNGVLTPMTDAEITEFNASKPTEAQILNQKWQEIRNKRNSLLAECDWRAFSDVTLSDEWKTYRQELRDVPTQSDPDNITWPTKPN